jgi:hypothetical protein
VRWQTREGCINEAPQARTLALKLERATEQTQAHARHAWQPLAKRVGRYVRRTQFGAHRCGRLATT